MWDAAGPIKEEHQLALQIGGAYSYARPVQFTADSSAWLLHGDFLYDRKLKAITWIMRVPPLAAYFPRPFLDADHVLGTRGGSGPRERALRQAPAGRTAGRAEALTSGQEALLKPGDTVSISVEVGDTRFADKAGVANQLQELLAKRLADGGLKVGPNSPLAMTLKYSESQGQQLKVTSGLGPFAKQTGQTVQETLVVLDAKLFHQATKKVLWERTEKKGNPHMLSGTEVSDQAVRKQTFGMVQYLLSSMSLPYYVSADPKPPRCRSLRACEPPPNDNSRSKTAPRRTTVQRGEPQPREESPTNLGRRRMGSRSSYSLSLPGLPKPFPAANRE